MRKSRIAVASLVTLVAVVAAVFLLGPGAAMASSSESGAGWVLGRGIVSTPDSELVRGYGFRLNARINEDGDARGVFAARVHLRNNVDAITDESQRIVKIRARFNEGALGENHVKLTGVAQVRLANGKVLDDLPMKLGVRLEERGEYGMVLEIGDRVLEGRGVAGDVIIFHQPSDRLAPDSAQEVR